MNFNFTFESAEASHVAWEHMDYEHTSDAFLLECAFNCHGKDPQVVKLPLPRVAGFSRYHNPTRLSHLVGGVLVRHCRSYNPQKKLGQFELWAWNKALLIFRMGKFIKQSKISVSTKVHN